MFYLAVSLCSERWMLCTTWSDGPKWRRPHKRSEHKETVALGSWSRGCGRHSAAVARFSGMNSSMVSRKSWNWAVDPAAHSYFSSNTSNSPHGSGWRCASIHPTYTHTHTRSKHSHAKLKDMKQHAKCQGGLFSMNVVPALSEGKLWIQVKLNK